MGMIGRELLQKYWRYLFVIFLVLLVVFPSVSSGAATSGLILWVQAVLPAMLPFVLCAGIISRLGIADDFSLRLHRPMRALTGAAPSGAYALLMGLLSGYPVTAKICGELIGQKKMSPRSAERVLAFSSTAGPAFIFSSVAVSMMKMPGMMLPLGIGHYGGALLCGLVHRMAYGRCEDSGRLRERRTDPQPLGRAMGESAADATQTLLIIGMFIAFYAVAVAVLDYCGVLPFIARLLEYTGMDESMAKAMTVGMLEVTNACYVASTSLGPIPLKAGLVAGLISFGGLSVHSQALAFLAKSGINPIRTVLWKIVHGLLALILSAVSCLIFPQVVSTSGISSQYAQIHWQNTLSGALTAALALSILAILVTQIPRGKRLRVKDQTQR
ncbi:MAG: hypothetical protein ACOX88_04470 [Christensenellales bacterium]